MNKNIWNNRSLLISLVFLVMFASTLSGCIVVSLQRHGGKRVAATSIPTPTLARLELITNQAATGDGGNGWSNHKNRIIRTSTGDIFAAYVSAGNGGNDKQYVLMHRAVQGGWTQVLQGDGGYEPVNLLRGPHDEIHVFAWPGAKGTLQDIETTDLGKTFTTTIIPGLWESSQGYAGSGTDALGDLVVVQTDGYHPGYFLWAYYSHTTHQWQFHTSQIDYRYTYGYYLPGTNGDLTITAVRDVPSTVIGGSDPNSYIFDAIKYFHTTSVTTPTLSELIVKQDSNAGSSGQIAITTWISDTYIDTEGRTHILYVDNGSCHNVIIQNGTIVKDAPLQVADVYKVRMIQDTTGRFYLLDLNGGTLDVYPASTGDTDGTKFGSPVALSLGQYPSCSEGSLCQAPHLAAPRGGTPLADYVDGVYNSGHGEQWVYFRVNL